MLSSPLGGEGGAPARSQATRALARRVRGEFGDAKEARHKARLFFFRRRGLLRYHRRVIP